MPMTGTSRRGPWRSLLWPLMINAPVFYLIFTLGSANAVDEFMAVHGGPSRAPWSSGLVIGVMLLWAILTVLTMLVFRLGDRVKHLENVLAAFRDATPISAD